jgi:putative transcriptional regulator
VGRRQIPVTVGRIAGITAAVAVLASAATAARWRLLVPIQAGRSATELAAGKLLVARHKLLDPNFSQTVVLLVQHDEKGTVGLIINRPTKITLSRLSKEMEGAKGRSDPLYLGGPVETSGVMALVRSRTKPEDSKHVFADIYLLSSKAALEKNMASSADSTTLRVYLGYAGWDAEQLEWELSMDAWEVLPANPGIVFDPHPESLWPRLSGQDDLQVAGVLNGAFTPCCSWI